MSSRSLLAAPSATIWCRVGGPPIGVVVVFPFRVTVRVPVPPTTT